MRPSFNNYIGRIIIFFGTIRETPFGVKKFDRRLVFVVKKLVEFLDTCNEDWLICLFFFGLIVEFLNLFVLKCV